MIDTRDFVQHCRELGITAVAGVPDSLLREVTAELEIYYGDKHKILANEGSAVAHAVGLYAARPELTMVYMQNSGLGNALNPLVSLANSNVFGVPMVLLIGWRGELGYDGVQISDEPQHLLQGRITRGILDLAEIPHVILDAQSDAVKILHDMCAMARDVCGPVALLVTKGAFDDPNRVSTRPETLFPSREECIEVISNSLPDLAPVIAATGMIGRELSEVRQKRGIQGKSDLLVVGGMGHASTIAAAFSSALSGAKVICLDGDGGVLMHMGALPHVAQERGLVHIMLNNGVHDSVGGQATIANTLDFDALSQGAGYGCYLRCNRLDQIPDAILNAMDSPGSSFIEVMCRPGHRPNLGRPLQSPFDLFANFSSRLRPNQVR